MDGHCPILLFYHLAMGRRRLSEILINPGWIGSLLSFLCVASFTLGIYFNYAYYGNIPLYVVLAVLDLLSFGYLVYLIVIFCIHIYKTHVYPWLYDHKLTKPLVTNYALQSAVSAVISVAINVGFAVFNMVIALLNGSIWYGAFAAYYFVLIGLRTATVSTYYRAARKHWFDKKALELAKKKISLVTGCFLFLMEASMAFLIGHMVSDTPPVVQSVAFAVVNAIYALYKLIVAIVNTVLSRLSGDSIGKTLKDISLADTCMSLMSLTVVLISTFGAEPYIAIKAIVGFGACLVVGFLCVLTIVREAVGIYRFHAQSKNG